MAGKAPVSHQSVCMSLRKSPAEQQQQRATTFHVCPVACSKCLFFVTSTPCPARRTHPAHAVFYAADEQTWKDFAVASLLR